MAKLLILDLAAVFRRAWHATDVQSRAILPDGRSYHGVHGAVQIAIRAVKTHKPDLILVASEASSANSTRRELMPEYKAHRPAPDVDLVAQFRDTWSVLASANWPVVSFYRKEADDVIASAARNYDGETVILSGDRDLLALCSERARVALFKHGTQDSQLFGPDECKKLTGVLPHQLCEYKALAGDTSDGIPGIAGIGPKSAAKILGHYGTLRDAYADQLLIGVPPQVRSAFREGREQAQLSYRLARLDTSLPVAERWRPTQECFGTEQAGRVGGLGFTQTARLFERLPQ